MSQYSAPEVGTLCERQMRTARKGAEFVPPKPAHEIQAPDDDVDLQKVLVWLRTKPGIKNLLTDAVVDAVDYILDGSHTGRFDLDDPDVDSDERASVGTKVQYRIITTLELIKERPLDTHIAGVPVDIKNTIGDSWMIPKEAQCEICLLIQIDNQRDRFSARLMRTHETMLRPGKNQDSKRGILAEARDRYAIALFDELWLPMPRNPLRDLTPEQRAIVLNSDGLTKRSVALFSFMPNVVIPRRSIETIGANLKDPMRRVREARTELRLLHSLELLGGKWLSERALALQLGFVLGEEDWVAVPTADVVIPPVPVELVAPDPTLPTADVVTPPVAVELVTPDPMLPTPSRLSTPS